jgi:phage baseplate assembly protein W
MTVDKTFLGTGWCFPPEFSTVGHGVRTVSEEDDIRESLAILLTTNPGERVMQPGYGCGLRAMVFESLSANRMTLMKEIIKKAVLFYEPRIELNFIDLQQEDDREGVIHVLLDYTIRRTNTRSNMVYPFYFQEGTDVMD